MTTNFERVAWGIALLAFVPAFAVMGGFWLAIGIAFGTVSLYYGGRYGFRLYEHQNVGKKAGRFDVNSTLNGKSDGDNWGRK